jgi:Mrp family chromosome partitioning ATPase
MSALDQAFVKAYGQPAGAEASFSLGLSASTRAKPRDATETPDPEGAAAARMAERPASVPAPAIRAQPVESKPAPARKRRATATRGKAASAKAGRTPGTHQPKLVSRFRPLLEVDTFLWPKTIDSLAVTAAEALDQLAGNLLDHAKRGHKAIGWQSCRHGDGCSTLLLAVARSLTEHDLKVAVVDADFRHPRLARRLGLTPSAGWEEAAAGRVPLAEVVIESLRDGMVLVPWCGPTEPPDESFAPDLLLKPLRQNYDHVMVDLGHDSQHNRHAAWMASLRACLDVVLVVHNVGDVPTAEVNRLYRGLSKDGKAELAVVENFA